MSLGLEFLQLPVSCGFFSPRIFSIYWGSDNLQRQGVRGCPSAVVTIPSTGGQAGQDGNPDSASPFSSQTFVCEMRVHFLALTPRAMHFAGAHMLDTV